VVAVRKRAPDSRGDSSNGLPSPSRGLRSSVNLRNAGPGSQPAPGGGRGFAGGMIARAVHVDSSARRRKGTRELRRPAGRLQGMTEPGGPYYSVLAHSMMSWGTGAGSLAGRGIPLLFSSLLLFSCDLLVPYRNTTVQHTVPPLLAAARKTRLSRGSPSPCWAPTHRFHASR